MTWIIAHSSSPAVGEAQGLTIHPCYTEQGAKTYAREQVEKGHLVSAQTLEGVKPPRKISPRDITKWLTERDR
jgi:hypothetical protein